MAQILAETESREYVNIYVAGGGTYSAATMAFPGTSLALTVAEAHMINKIASIYGLRGLSGSVLRSQLFKGVMLYGGGSTALKLLSEALTAVPVIGWLAKPAVASTAIKGFGEATIAYFENKFPGQKAYKRPAWEDFLSAFGAAVGADTSDLHEIWEGLDSGEG